MVNKKYKRYQAALAFALSLGLAFSGGVPVHADEPEDSTETVSVPTEDEENDVTVGNITITDDQLGALVDTRFTEQDVTLTVKGDIVVDSPDYGDDWVSGVDIYGRYGNSATVNVEGDINLTGDQSVNSGIYAELEDESKASVTVGGDIIGNATGNCGYYSSAYGITWDNDNASSDVTVGGSVEVTADDAKGIDYNIYSESTSSLNVGGSINADGNEEAYGVIVYSSDSEYSAVIGESITATSSEGEAHGLSEFDKNSTFDIEVGDSIEVSGAGNIDGLSISSGNSEGYVSVKGDINVASASENENNDIVGLRVFNDYSEVSVEIGGDIIVIGDSEKQAAIVIDYDSYYGSESERDAGETSVITGGDIISDGYGIVIKNEYLSGDDVKPIINTNIIVDGTIDAAKGAIVQAFADSKDPDAECILANDVTLTVWKIELNEARNAAVKTESSDPDNLEVVADSDFEKNIMYIIKVEQPETGGTLSARNAAGEALVRSGDYDTAKEGEKVILDADVAYGYLLTGAYNGNGEKTELLKDENGNYYVIVEKGGGVYLSAEYAKQKFLIKYYDENGNVIETKEIEYGTTITLPDAPVREGYKFLYWQGSKYYPGDKYVVEGDHQFTAVWEKIEETKENKTEESKETEIAKTKEEPKVTTDVKKVVKDESPKTGDDFQDMMIIFWLMSMLCITSVVVIKKKRK